MVYGEVPPTLIETVSAGSTPAKPVPVSCARVGLLVALSVMVRHLVMRLYVAGDTVCQAPRPPKRPGSTIAGWWRPRAHSRRR